MVLASPKNDVEGGQAVASMKDPLSSRKVQILLRRSLLHHPRRLRRRSICPFPTWANGCTMCPSSQHPLSPRRREINNALPPGFFELGRRDVTLKHLSGLIPQGNVPCNEIRKTPPFTQSTVPCLRQAVMPLLGVVFPQVVTSTSTGSLDPLSRKPCFRQRPNSLTFFYPLPPAGAGA